MTTSRPHSTDRRAELRTEMDARIQQERRRPLPSWLSDHRNRRALALTPAVTFTLGAAGAGVRDEMLGLGIVGVATALAVVGTVLLRQATRMLDNAPVQLLDERETVERERAHRRGYHLTTVLLTVLVVLAVVDAFLAKTAHGPLFVDDGWIHLTFTALLAVSMLPAAALAWFWTAPADPEDDLDD